MADEPVFQEQIAVSLDLTPLQAQLDEMVKMYQDALGKAGDGLPNFISSSSLNTFGADLEKVSTELKDFAIVFQDALSESAAAIAEKVEGAAVKTASRTKKAASDASDELKTLATNAQRTMEVIQQITAGDRNQPNIMANTFNEGEIYKHVQDMLAEANQRGAPNEATDKLSNANQAWFQRRQQEEALDLNKQSEAKAREAEEEIELVNRVLREQELATQKRLDMEAQVDAKLDERYEKVAAQANKELEVKEQEANEEIALVNRTLREYELAGQKRVEMEAQVAAKLQKQNEQIAGQVNTELRRKLSADVDPVADLEAEARRYASKADTLAGRAGSSNEVKEAAAQAAAYAKQAAEALNQAVASAHNLEPALLADARAAAEVAAEAAQVQYNLAKTASDDKLGNFFRRTGEDFGTTLAQVAKFQLLWQGVGAVIQGVTAIIEAPFKAIAQGVEYLNQMQDKADQLAGVFNSSLKFSSDMAEQLHKSEEAAAGVVQQLREISATKNLSFDSLFNATKSLTSNGAGNLTDGSLEQTVQLAERFAVTVKATRGDLNTQRLILSQLPNLLTGQVTGLNQILETLGLTDKQWNGIVASARVNHDLVQQLEPYFAPFVSQLDVAQQHQTELKNQLGLMFTEAEAHFSKGLWELWSEILEKAAKFLKDNEVSIDALAGYLGDVVENAARFVTNLFGADTEAQKLNRTFTVLAEAVGYAGKTVSLLVADLHEAVQLGGDISRLSPIAAYNQKGTVDDLTSNFQQFERERDQIQKQYDDFYSKLENPKDFHPKADSSVDLEAPLEQKHGLPEKDTKSKNESGQLRSDIEARLNQQISAAEELRKKKEADADYDFAHQRINEQQLHDMKMAALQEEAAAIAVVESRGLKQLGNIPGQTALQTDRARTALTTRTGNIESGIGVDETHDNDTLAKSQESLSLNQLRQSNQERQNLLRIQLEQARQFGTSEVEVMRMEAQARAATFASEQADLQRQISVEADGSNKRIELQQQYNSSVNNAREQALADAKAIDNKGAQDRLDALKASQDADAETLRAQLEKAQGSEGPQASRRQRQAIADLAAEYAVLLEQQKLVLQTQLEYDRQQGDSKQITDALTRAIEEKNKAIDSAVGKATSDQRKATTGSSGDLANNLLGGGVTNFSQFGKDQDSQGNFSGSRQFDTSVGELQHAFDQLSKSAVSIFKDFSGPSENKLAGVGEAASVAGGIGTSVGKELDGSSGLLGKLGGAAGAFGPIASIAGSVISLFSEIFTAEAQRIATNIKNAFQATVTAYQNGAATLSTTLAVVQAQQVQAITQLSGKKGGKQQLNSLLPQLNQEIAALQNQQLQIQESFANNLAQLRLGGGLSNDPLSQMLQSWQQINDQVQQYISSGGSAQSAQEALSLTLRQISTTAYTNLTQGQEQGIQDALQLNQLLQQRIDLESSYQQQVNSLLTQGSAQRRASQGVTAGLQITELSANYNLQLEQINAQISLGEEQVALYRQIFDIQTGTVALEAQSNAANIASLKQQIQILKDYATEYSNISVNQAGQYSLNPGFQQSIGAITINVNNPNLTQQELTSSVTQALANAGKAGTGTTFTLFNNGG